MPERAPFIDGPEAFQKQFNVSRETLSRLIIYEELLRKWQSRINLIGPNTVDQIWSRHIADCAQVSLLAKKSCTHWLDIGSGAGLPGLIIAICRSQSDSCHVHLVESNGKKCAFLRTAVRETGAKATVHHMRLEDFAKKKAKKIDVITARAVAPLAELLEMCQPFFPHKPEILIQKGQDVDDELTQAAKCWIIDVEKSVSLVDNNSTILKIINPQKRM